MNDTFNFKRFRTYFVYDLKQMWRRHSKAAILIGGSIAFFYVIWVLITLLTSHHWGSPVIEARCMMLLMAFTILELYQARTYGHLTEKQAGSTYLLIPSSGTEKFISMLLMTLVVIPLLFVVVFFGLDGILSLVDPTYGESLISGFAGIWSAFLEGVTQINGESPVVFSSAAFLLLAIVGFFCNYMYFLLCGICFKKNKIGWAILILFGLSSVLSLITGMAIPAMVSGWADFDPDTLQVAKMTAGFLNGTLVVTCLLAIGLGWGIWYRIKTLQQ